MVTLYAYHLQIAPVESGLPPTFVMSPVAPGDLAAKVSQGLVREINLPAVVPTIEVSNTLSSVLATLSQVGSMGYGVVTKVNFGGI